MGDSYQIKDQSATYFLTFQVVGWADIFTRKIYKDIIIESLKYCKTNKGLEIFAYVIMSNHVHVIFRSKDGKLSNIIRDFKKYTSNRILSEIINNRKESRKEWLLMVFSFHGRYNKRIQRYQFWTHESHAVELSTNSMVDSRIQYIHDNPVRADWVQCPEDYLYSSASDIVGTEKLIELDEI